MYTQMFSRDNGRREILVLDVGAAIVLSSRNKTFPRKPFRVCIFQNALFLDLRDSILERLEL